MHSPAALVSKAVPPSPLSLWASRRTWYAVVFWLVMGAVPGTRGAEEPTGAFFRDWLLCGPFPVLTAEAADLEAIRLPGFYADWLSASGGETAVRPKEGEEVRHAGGIAVWRGYRSETDALNLDVAVSKTNGVVAYAYREIESERDVVCLLSVGSNDGARVWWNGEEILDAPGPRGLKLDHHLVPVSLGKGVNRLLVKIEERGNSWRLACRLLPLGHQGFAERLRLFEVQTSAEGVPTIRARSSQALMSALVKSARFEVVPEAAPERTLWTGDWRGESSLGVGVSIARFRRFRMRAQVALAEGGRQEWTVPFTAGRRSEHVLFEGGRSAYRIVLDQAASESERWAAGELQRWLTEIGGVSLPVHTGSGAWLGGEKEIHLGWSDPVRGLLGEDAKPPSDSDEGFHYQSVGDAIVIWGGRQRGTMHGVMSFLERELGVRFYTPSVTVAPKRERWGFTGLDHAESPGVRVRNDFYFEAFDPTWAARNRVNGAMSPRPQPGGVETYWSVHTFYPLVPPEEFFREHPEYFSLIEGVRTHERAQLCLTQPDVLRIVIERLRRRMRESPEYLIYDVSQNDWAGPCECAACRALAEREGSESGPVLHFVNQVADAVREEFPTKFVGTLAYQYTRKPPRMVKPRDNVVVRFCSIECCFAHPFTTCPENRDFVADMDGWARMAPHLYIWDYVVNFSHYVMPYPNFRALAPNIRFFRDHRAIGIMEQGAYQSRGGEFAELRAYVLARLLWDPEAAVEPIVADFMHGYYGRAGQFVQAYFDLLHGRLTPETH
ncbi:MAG: DUF4838 domain-containing protein, partial [Verrucomicrobiales bacterium]|nr:DUF4838 domain-containing protein [Verrucomicrobiales bacterium]